MLTTARLRLCRFSERHADGFGDLISDPEVARFIGTGKPRPASDAHDQIAVINERYEANGFGQLAIERADTGEFVGRVGFVVWDHGSWTPHPPISALGATAVAELGWALRRAVWGNGFATEAAARMRDYAFQVLLLTRLVSLIRLENVASQRVAKRLGAAIEQRIVVRRQPCDLFSHRQLNRPGSG